MSNIVKNTTILNPLDLLIPHSCRGCGRVGNVLCDRCKNYIISTREELCPNCKAPTKNGICNFCKNLPPIYYVGPREGLLDTIIHNFKYNSVRALGPKLAELLDAILPLDLSNIVTVPLPTTSRHIRARGFDHTMNIAKHLTRLRHYALEPLLMRTNNFVQVGADALTREIQASSAYTINPTYTPDPTKTYLLLDDIWTTGSSMKAAVNELSTAGIKNIIISVLAVSQI